MIIRRANANDAAEIARLSSELGYPVDIKTIAARLDLLLSNASHCVLVACKPDTARALLGWAAAEHRVLLESGERVELIGLVVDSGARRQGVGRSLMSAAEQWARECRVDSLLLRSNVLRPESHSFYLNLGYSCSKTQHVYTRRLN